MSLLKKIGDKGEELAMTLLKNKGFEILEKNYRYKRSEIDLIIKKNDLIVFIEVKTRTNTSFGNPEDFVDEKKMEKVRVGAEAYMELIQWEKNIRFDIIAIVSKNGQDQVVHFEDAY